MIEPEVTAGLGRRVPAFLIDSALVAATGLGVAFQQSTAFPVVGRDAADEPLVDPAQFADLEELGTFEIFGQSEILGVPLVRAQELGNSIRVFSGDSYQFGLLAAAIAAVVVFGLIPIVLQRTIGMMPFGIGIRKNDGTRAGVGAHLVRTIIGIVDAVPFVIPGALGFLAAGVSTHRQRLGDRVAKTAVVDLEALRLSQGSRTKVDLHLRPADEPGHTDAEVASSFTQGDGPKGPTRVEALEAAQNAMPGATRSPADTAPTPARRAADAVKPPVATPTMGDPLPPPPVHRKAPGEHPLGTPSHRGVDDHSAAHDVAPDFQAASEVDAPTASAAKHLSIPEPLPLGLDTPEKNTPGGIEIPDGAWQPPREEPAPVWQPTTLQTAPIESPDPHDGRTLDDVQRIDPSIGALLAEASTTNETTDSTRSGNHTQKQSSAKTPVWSDKWRAWMYWDTSKKCWLRHDTASNTWQPVD